MVKEYVIYDIPKSNNEYMGSGGKGRNFEYQKDKKRWARKIKKAVGDNKPNTPIKKSIVTIRYFFKTRHTRDPDNYSGKFILDGLKRAGIIEDDSFKHIRLRLDGDYDKNNPRTVISIEQVDETINTINSIRNDIHHCNKLNIQGVGELSDGYHTFDELYHHRMVLFAVICNQNKPIAWKSKLHADGTMYDDYFIAGITTPEGNYTYHYHIDNWDYFEIDEINKAPEWDGHKPSDITRLFTI